MKVLRCLLGLCALAVICVWSATAQEPLTNDSVIKMVKAGLSEDVIASMVKSQPANYTVTPDDLIALKTAGVTDKVVEAMLGKSTVSGSGATTGNGKVAGNPNDPVTPHDSGIYLLTKDRDGNPQMIVLERAASQAMKTGGGCGLVIGLKCKTKAVIPGPAASIRTGESTPTFYFYFEDRAAGLGRGYLGASIASPNQFALLHLDVSKSNRETTVGSFGVTGGSTGTDSKAMMAFRSERIRPGLYKVVPSQPLQPGQYCFLTSSAAGAMGGGDMFDFAVNQNQ